MREFFLVCLLIVAGVTASHILRDFVHGDRSDERAAMQQFNAVHGIPVR